jgi:hypothetical protein
MRYAVPPQRFALPEEKELLRQAVTPTMPAGGALDAILTLASDLDARLAFLEGDYIDADYRDEYSHFYATTYRPFQDRCKRLHFYAGADDGFEYLGFSVIRPVRNRPIGRTMIQPRAKDAAFVSGTAPDSVSAHGESYGIQAFPFMEQDSQMGSCAHVSIWMTAYYHHLVHRTPRRMMSDIVAGARKHSSPLRDLPSGGLTIEQINASLLHLGFQSMIYRISDLRRRQPEEIACRYLNSRLPVILQVPGHAVVLIGYGRDTNGKLFFIRSDEGSAPYQRIYRDDDPIGHWDRLIVPFPGKIYMTGEVAERAARQAFAALLRARRQESSIYDLRLRTYVARVSDYKRDLIDRGVPPEIAASHRFVGTSNWIWITELQDPAVASRSRRCVIGEIAVDATSNQEDPNLIFGNLPGVKYIWPDEGSVAVVDETAPTYDAYETGTAIHDLPVGIPIPRTTADRVSGMRRRIAARVR